MLSPNEQDPCYHGIGCALLPWCASAQRLRDAVMRSPTLNVRIDTLLVLGEPRRRGQSYTAHAAQVRRPSNNADGTICLTSNATEELDTRDCPGVRKIWAGAQLRRAVQLHEDRVIKSGVMSYDPEYIRRMAKVLFKWELMRQNDYAAILFSDLDVDLLPSFVRGQEAAEAERVSHEWGARLPELLRAAGHPTTPFNLLGYGDATSPWVAGLFWVFPPPRQALFWEGIRMLSAPWNATHGFNRSGTPHQLWGGTPTVPKTLGRHADGTPSGPLLSQHSRFGNGWQHVDGGDLEQGFFLNMLWNRSPQLGVFVDRRQKDSHGVAHYVRSPRKPWLRALTYDAAREDSCDAYADWMRHFYLAALVKLPLVQHPATACARAFKHAYSDMDKRLKSTVCEARSVELWCKKLWSKQLEGSRSQRQKTTSGGSKEKGSKHNCQAPYGGPGGHDRLMLNVP